MTGSVFFKEKNNIKERFHIMQQTLQEAIEIREKTLAFLESTKDVIAPSPNLIEKIAAANRKILRVNKIIVDSTIILRDNYQDLLNEESQKQYTF